MDAGSAVNEGKDEEEWEGARWGSAALCNELMPMCMCSVCKYAGADVFNRVGNIDCAKRTQMRRGELIKVCECTCVCFSCPMIISMSVCDYSLTCRLWL